MPESRAGAPAVDLLLSLVGGKGIGTAAKAGRAAARKASLFAKKTTNRAIQKSSLISEKAKGKISDRLANTELKAQQKQIEKRAQERALKDLEAHRKASPDPLSPEAEARILSRSFKKARDAEAQAIKRQARGLVERAHMSTNNILMKNAMRKELGEGLDLDARERIQYIYDRNVEIGSSAAQRRRADLFRTESRERRERRERLLSGER